MIDHKQIDLDNDMPDLREILEDHDLLRYRYFITIGDIRDRDVKYYKIEDEEVEKQYSETCEDMSRHMQNAEIKILTNGKIILTYKYEGHKPYECQYENNRDWIIKDTNFNLWLEKRIIEVINKRNNYYLD